MKRSQTGVGLVEVLVALVILGIAVLGFVALQVRALAASQEASLNVQAMTLARDLSERMRTNREGLEDYQSVTSPPTTCGTAYCTPNQMAQYDFKQVSDKAKAAGMSIAVINCFQGSDDLQTRKCIYIAWGDTIPTAEPANSTSKTACTVGASYRAKAECVIMETYNDE